MSGMIVVGTDGSVCARLAVRWAAREAAVRRAALMIVSVWDFPDGGLHLRRARVLGRHHGGHPGVGKAERSRRA